MAGRTSRLLYAAGAGALIGAISGGPDGADYMMGRALGAGLRSEVAHMHGEGGRFARDVLRGVSYGGGYGGGYGIPRYPAAPVILAGGGGYGYGGVMVRPDIYGARVYGAPAVAVPVIPAMAVYRQEPNWVNNPFRMLADAITGRRASPYAEPDVYRPRPGPDGVYGNPSRLPSGPAIVPQVDPNAPGARVGGAQPLRQPNVDPVDLAARDAKRAFDVQKQAFEAGLTDAQRAAWAKSKEEAGFLSHPGDSGFVKTLSSEQKVGFIKLQEAELRAVSTSIPQLQQRVDRADAAAKSSAEAFTASLTPEQRQAQNNLQFMPTGRGHSTPPPNPHGEAMGWAAVPDNPAQMKAYKEAEQAFLNGLTPQQRELYQKSVRDGEALSKARQSEGEAFSRKGQLETGLQANRFFVSLTPEQQKLFDDKDAPPEHKKDKKGHKGHEAPVDYLKRQAERDAKFTESLSPEQKLLYDDYKKAERDKRMGDVQGSAPKPFDSAVGRLAAVVDNDRGVDTLVGKTVGVGAKISAADPLIKADGLADGLSGRFNSVARDITVATPSPAAPKVERSGAALDDLAAGAETGRFDQSVYERARKFTQAPGGMA